MIARDGDAGLGRVKSLVMPGDSQRTLWLLVSDLSTVPRSLKQEIEKTREDWGKKAIESSWQGSISYAGKMTCMHVQIAPRNHEFDNYLELEALSTSTHSSHLSQVLSVCVL